MVTRLVVAPLALFGAAQPRGVDFVTPAFSTHVTRNIIYANAPIAGRRDRRSRSCWICMNQRETARPGRDLRSWRFMAAGGPRGRRATGIPLFGPTKPTIDQPFGRTNSRNAREFHIDSKSKSVCISDRP